MTHASISEAIALFSSSEYCKFFEPSGVYHDTIWKECSKKKKKKKGMLEQTHNQIKMVRNI